MILNENLFENKPVKFPKTDYYIRVKEGVELVNGKVKEFEDGIKIGIHETPYGKVASDVRTGYKIIGTGSPLVQSVDKYIYGNKNDEELFNQAYDLLKSIDQDYYNSLPNAIDYVENLTEAKGVRGTQKGEKRGSYKKADTESKYEKVTSTIDKQVEWVAKGNGKKVLKKLTAYPTMKVKNEFYFDAVTPSLLEKGKAVLDKFNIDYKEEDGKVSWVFKNEDFDEVNLDKVGYKTKGLFREDVEDKFILSTDQKQFILDDLFEDEDLHNFYHGKLNTDWVITSNKELDPIRNPSDDAQFPYVLLIDNEFVDALSKDYINKVKSSLTEGTFTSKEPNNSEMSFDIKDDGTIIIYDGSKEIKRSKTNPEYAKQVLKDLGFKEKELVKESFEEDNRIKESVEYDFEDITNMSDAKNILKKYGIELIKHDDRNYTLSKDGKKYTMYILSNPNDVREDLVRAVKQLCNISETKELEQGLKEDYTDKTTIEDGGEIIPNSVEPGPDAGLATELNKLIRDEWEAIQGYNDAIVMAELEGFHDVAKVFKDIVNEENVHVGQLEQCMKLVSPNTDSIVHGEIEAEGQLGEDPTPVEKEEDPEEGMHY